jgi:hypothetical protein
MTTITLPNGGWRPRDYQRPAWDYMRQGGLRALLYWHRRSGKDEVALHWTAIASQKRVGNYWHMLPEQAQARKAIWDAVNPKTGKKRIDDAFPLAMRKRTLNNEMLIEFANGSTWQVVGSDNYDSLVGSTPIGVVGSEWALADPQAWSYISPILEENGGWAMFITTTRGKNHAFRMYESGRKNPKWFTQVLRSADTRIFNEDQLTRIRGELVDLHGTGIGGALYEQEYNSSFEAAVVGAVYGDEMARLRNDGRIRSVPYVRDKPVFTVWDIGGSDSTAIWFAQEVSGEMRLIDYYENRLKDVAHYADIIRGKGYSYGEAILPHDAFNRGSAVLAVGKTIAQLVEGFGFKVRQSPKLGNAKQSGIQSARMLLSRCYFDETKCARGIECLTSYRYETNNSTNELNREPLHDWASHGSDAFGYLAMSQDSMRGDRTASKPLKYPKMGHA